jgi:hypothetical protein
MTWEPVHIEWLRVVTRCGAACRRPFAEWLWERTGCHGSDGAMRATRRILVALVRFANRDPRTLGSLVVTPGRPRSEARPSAADLRTRSAPF